MSALSAAKETGRGAELKNFVGFHQLVLSPPPLLRGDGGEHWASGIRICRDAPYVMAEQHGQCDAENVRLQVVMKTGVVGNDCGLPVRLTEFVEKNVTSHLSALRTIFLEELHSATVVTPRCG